MALISCPNCGQSISDKAFVCPHCNYRNSNIFAINMTCPECGLQYNQEKSCCPACGCPNSMNASKKKKNSLDKNKITCYYKTVIITIIKNYFFYRTDGKQ